MVSIYQQTITHELACSQQSVCLQSMIAFENTKEMLLKGTELTKIRNQYKSTWLYLIA